MPYNTVTFRSSADCADNVPFRRANVRGTGGVLSTTRCPLTDSLFRTLTATVRHVVPIKRAARDVRIPGYSLVSCATALYDALTRMGNERACLSATAPVSHDDVPACRVGGRT